MQHVEAMAPCMRAADLAEVQALGYANAQEALEASLRASESAWVALVDSEVAAMFGVCPSAEQLLVPQAAVAWFLTAEAFGRHPRPLIRAARKVLPELLARYSLLGNMVDARYRGALRLLESLGFALGQPTPFGPLGLPFVPATLRSA